MTRPARMVDRTTKLNVNPLGMACEFSINQRAFFHWTVSALFSKMHTPYQEIGDEPNESSPLCS
jgi:hypothetical protein